MSLNGHQFHIPVMGTAFTIDTPIKIAKYGISSVVSIGDDELCENMRAQYSREYNIAYTPITKDPVNYRAERITAYLNLLDIIVKKQITQLKQEPFGQGHDIDTYFELLPEESQEKLLYLNMQTTEGEEKDTLQNQLRSSIKAGNIDVNIMTKLDRDNVDKNKTPLPPIYSDALSAFRGFANSTLESGIVFSAGFNRRLFAYIEQFADFLPNKNGKLKKKIIIKISDYRSCLTQGKFLAKKGIWVSEYRLESGLNCGGHAFATNGILMGPILEEIKNRKQELLTQLFEIYTTALNTKNLHPLAKVPATLFTAQGGIGTSNEQKFILKYYQIDKIGWATPFLLVPEVTAVDHDTRQLLAQSKKEDLYLSDISPLGVPFNTIRNTQSEKQKLKRFKDGRPGSPCPKGYLISNTEFTKRPICKASVLYQKRKIEQINTKDLSETKRTKQINQVITKVCLCEDLAASALINTKTDNKRPLKTAICPGPNLAYFSSIFSLKQMVGHIYGRFNALNDTSRSNLFINELKMYITHLTKEIKQALPEPDTKKIKYFNTFKDNILEGIEYYRNLAPKWIEKSKAYQDRMLKELAESKKELEQLMLTNIEIFPVLATS